MDSVFGKLIEAAHTVIAGLDLIPAQRVLRLETAAFTDTVVAKLPTIAVAPFGSEQITAATNLSDNIAYPMAVALVDDGKNTPEFGTLADAVCRKRDQLIDHLIRNRVSVSLPTGAWLMDQVIEPGPMLDPSWKREGLHVSAFVVRFVVRKRRRAA